MPIARYDSIRICIEIALVLMATILFSNTIRGLDVADQRIGGEGHDNISGDGPADYMPGTQEPT